MRASDLGRYFLFDADAIRRLAADRASLPTGAALVLMTTVAREYDERLLVHEPQLFLVGLVLSTGVAVVLHVLLRLLFRGRWTDEGRPGPAPEFRVMLAMVWLTAPLAWLYALPVERWTDPLTAAQLNVSALAIVALWRALLLTHVAGVLTGAGFRAAWHAVMAPSVMAFSVALAAMPGPVLNLMGGARLDPHERFLAEVKLYGPTLALLAAMALGLALVPRLLVQRGVPLRVRTFRTTGWDGAPRGFLGACVVVWGVLAAVYQPQVQRALALNAALVSKDLERSKALLLAFPRHEWPPRIPLHPDPHTGGAGDAVVALLNGGLIDALPAGHWYRAAVLDLLERRGFVWQHTWSERRDDSRAVAFAQAIAGSRAAMAWLEAHPDLDIQFHVDPQGRARAVLAPFFRRQFARLEAALSEHRAAIERAACDLGRARAGGTPDPDAEARLEAGKSGVQQILLGRRNRYDPADEQWLRAQGSSAGAPYELLDAIRAPAPRGPFAAVPPKYGSLVRLLRTAYLVDARKEMEKLGIPPPRFSAVWSLTWALESGHIMNLATRSAAAVPDARTVIADSAPLESPGVRELVQAYEAALAAPGKLEAAVQRQKAFLAALPGCASPTSP